MNYVENIEGDQVFISEVVKIAYYVINRSPSITIGLKTLIKMWNGKPTAYTSLHVFDCLIYMMYNC